MGGNEGVGALLQQGTDARVSATNERYAWWEAFTTGGRDAGSVEVSMTVNPGDQVTGTTVYDPNQGAQMNLYNRTTGVNFSTGWMTTIDGLPASTYWDPAGSADYIVERTQMTSILGNKYYSDLRPPDNIDHSSQFLNLYANGQDLQTTPVLLSEDWMYNGVELSTGRKHFLATATGPLGGPTNFIDYWNYCE